MHPNVSKKSCWRVRHGMLVMVGECEFQVVSLNSQSFSQENMLNTKNKGIKFVFIHFYKSHVTEILNGR